MSGVTSTRSASSRVAGDAFAKAVSALARRRACAAAGVLRSPVVVVRSAAVLLIASKV